MTHFLAVDPGVTSGLAWFDPAGKLLGYDSLSIARLFDFLDELDPQPPAVVIIEEYRIRPDKLMMHSGSTVPTIQVIGAVKFKANRWNSTIAMQSAVIKTVAQKWTGLVPLGSHEKTHHIDAINHGAYYLIKVAKLRNNRSVDPWKDLKGVR